MEERVIKIQAVVRGNLERRKQYALHPQLLNRNLRKKLKEDYEIWTRLDMNFLDDDFYHTINKRVTLKQNITYKHDISTELKQEKQAGIYTSGSEKSQDSSSSQSEKVGEKENISVEVEKDKEIQERIGREDAIDKEYVGLETIGEDRNGQREDSEKVEKLEEIENIGIVENIGEIEFKNEEQDRKEKEECNKIGIEVKEDEMNRKVEENYNRLERVLDTSCYSNPFGPDDIRDISNTQYHLDSVSSVSFEELRKQDPFELNNSCIVKDSEFQHDFDMQIRAGSSSSVQDARASHLQNLPIQTENQASTIYSENEPRPQLENTEDINQSWNKRSMYEGQNLLKKKSSDSNAQFIIVVHNVSDQHINNPYVEDVHDEHNESRVDQNVSNVSCNKKIVFSFNVSALDSDDSYESERSMNMIYKDKEFEEGKTDSHIDGIVDKPDQQEDKEIKQNEEYTGHSEDSSIEKKEVNIEFNGDRREEDQSPLDGNQRSSFIGNKNSTSGVITNGRSESESHFIDQNLVRTSQIDISNFPEAQDSVSIIKKDTDFEISKSYTDPGKPPSIQVSDKPEDKNSIINITKEEDIKIAQFLLEPDSLEDQESLLINNKEYVTFQLSEFPEPKEPAVQDSALSRVKEGDHVISPIIDEFCKENHKEPDLNIQEKADHGLPSKSMNSVLVMNIETGNKISHKLTDTEETESENSKLPAENQEELVKLIKSSEPSLKQNEEMVHIINKEADISGTGKQKDNYDRNYKPEAQDLSNIMNKGANSSMKPSYRSEDQDSSVYSSKHSINNCSRSSSSLDKAHSFTDSFASNSSKSDKSQNPKSSNGSNKSSSFSNPAADSQIPLVQIPSDQIPSQCTPIHPSEQSEMHHPDPSSPHKSPLMNHSITHLQESDNGISHRTDHQNASNSLSFSCSHRSDYHYGFDSFTQSTVKRSFKPSDGIMPNISIAEGNPHHEPESDFPMYSAGIFIEDLKAFKIETSSMNNSRASLSRPQTLRGTAENSQFVNADSIKSQSKLEVKVESGVARYRELTPEQLAEEENLMLHEAVDQHGISSHNLIRDTPFKSNSKIKLAEIKSPENISSYSNISATPSVIKHRVLQVTRHKAFTSTKNRPDMIKKDTRIDDNAPPLMIPKDISSNPHHIPNRSSKSSLSNNKLDMPVINEQLATRVDSKPKLNVEAAEAFNSVKLNTLKKQGSNMLSLPKLNKEFSSSVQASAYTSGRLDQLLSPGSKLFMPPARLVSTAYQKELPKPKFIESPYSVGWTDKILKTFYDVKVEILQGKGSFKPKYKLKKASAVNLPNLKLKKEPSLTLEPIKKDKKTL
jgi:hypothetical protein